VGTRRSAAAEFNPGYIPYVEGLDLIAHFNLDLARGTAEVGSIDSAAILQGDDVGVTDSREAESDGNG
jgi:hypothetical protein